MSFLSARPFERAMWLWGRDALLLGQLPDALTSSRRFLDVGCGAGLLAITAAAMGFDVTAVDLSVSEIDLLDAKIATAPTDSPTRTITTCVGDGQTLATVADESIDVVGSVFGIFMFPDRVAAWTSARRTLTPGGRLLATSWDATSGNVRMMRYLMTVPTDRDRVETKPAETKPAPPPNRSMEAVSFRVELEECGFMNVAVHTVSHPMTFTSGRELVESLEASEWVQSVVGHKDPASLKRSALDFVQLVLDGQDPFGEDAASKIRVARDISAEQHPLWTASFAIQALGHIAVATKP